MEKVPAVKNKRRQRGRKSGTGKVKEGGTEEMSSTRAEPLQMEPLRMKPAQTERTKREQAEKNFSIGVKRLVFIF